MIRPILTAARGEAKQSIFILLDIKVTDFIHSKQNVKISLRKTKSFKHVDQHKTFEHSKSLIHLSLSECQAASYRSDLTQQGLKLKLLWRSFLFFFQSYYSKLFRIKVIPDVNPSNEQPRLSRPYLASPYGHFGYDTHTNSSLIPLTHEYFGNGYVCVKISFGHIKSHNFTLFL